MTTKSSSKQTLKTYDRLNQVDPASISWHNIEVTAKPQKQNCFFKSKQKEIRLIKGVSGFVKQGKTLAIMGSSGAGKTTLLNVLTARNLSNGVMNVNGVVKINGQEADVKMITELTAYVQQNDLFIPLLTVREHLVFQAMVRMDRSIPLKVRAARINQVLEELSLLKCAETRVGGVSFKGISGGEMKRLSFAVEILTNPAIMFCDEPTSGLDAFMAKKLVQKIRQMALAGRTIICTIHQPSSDVFNLFDNLLLLADGRVAYMGPLSEAIAYFNNLGYKCPNNYNPADFFVNELAIQPGQEFESRNKINMICDFYLQKHCPKETLRNNKSSFLNIPNHSPYKATNWQQWKALTWRSSIVASRQPMLLYIRLLQALTISTMFGLVYFQQEYNNIGVININTALYLLCSNMVYQNTLAVINTFSAELPIFIREHSNGQYGVAPYFFGKNLAELPVFVAVPIVFVLINYFLVGFTLDSVENFLFTMTVALFLSTLGVGLGYFMSCVCGDADLALAISPPILMFLQLFGGFLVNIHKIPAYFRWAKDLSFYRYAFDLLMYNQWRNVSSLDCVPTNDLAIGEPNNLIDANSSSRASLNQGKTMCFKDGLQIMDFYAINRSSIFLYFGVLLLFNIGIRFIGYLALWVRSRARG